MTTLECIGQWASGPNEVVIQQWNRSIVQEWWFISTWEASERAMALHLEVCEATLHLPPVPHWQGLGLAMPKRKSHSGRHVHFEKFAEGFFQDPHGEVWNRFDLLHRDDQQQVGPHAHAIDSKKLRLFDLLPVRQSPWLNASQQWPLHQHRINDEWHNVPSRLSTLAGPEGDPAHGEDHFNLNEAPNTIQELYNTFLEHHLVEGPQLAEAIHLRTWYLHHSHVRQWHTPRIIELDGHWRHWARDIAGGWRDHIRADEDIAFYVCYPNPPRNVPIQFEVVFDLIITQGLEMPFWAGLITVLRAGDRAARADYSLAVSLPQFVSGFLLAQEANQLQQCHLRGCRLRHARNEIPFSIDPVHAMTNGDSFIIVPASSTAAAATTHAEVANEDAQMDYEQEESLHDEPPDHDHDDPPGDDSSSSEAPSDLQAVHIFRLGHLPIFGHLDWRSYHAALRDATQLVRAPLNQFVGFHYVHASLTGHQAGEEAIILQNVNDLALGSLERLVIVDTVLHTNRLNQGIPDNPAVTREVYKVQPQLARRHLLLLTHVDAYCTWMADTCIVEHNGQVWHRNDPQLRQVEHGAVFRIQLPPPLDPAWNIGQAVRVAYETGEILDFPEAGQLAHSILEGSVDDNRLHFGTDARAGARLVTCKGNDEVEDIDIPTTLPPGTRTRRLRPRHDGNFDWLDRLVEVFRAHAEVEIIDGDPMLYIQTWFIHHERLRRCPEPRPVRLDNAIIGWLEEFRFTWRDLLDRHLPFSVHVVLPRPPQLRLQAYAGHVILVQAHHPQRAAGIVTNLFEGPDRDAIQQFATSFPKRINKPLVIDELRLQPQCDTRRCTIHACGTPVHLILMTDLPDGFNLCTRIADVATQRPIPPHAEVGHFDDVAFMQSSHSQPAAAVGAGSSASPTQPAACEEFVFNPAAPPFVPGADPLKLMSEFTQDIHALWIQEAFQWENEDKSCVFTTWLVHHNRDFRHCTRPREVRLHEDFTAWESQIRRTWQDELDEHSDLEFHLVTPTPQPIVGQVTGHIIIIKNQIDVLVTSLVTVIDHTRDEGHGRLQRMAATTHEHLRLEDILEVVGYGGACIPQNAPMNCRAWIGDERLHFRRPAPGRSGDHVHINVHRRVAPPGDGLNLLQLQASTLSMADERLTQVTVAQVPGPSDHDHEREWDLDIATTFVRLLRGTDDLAALPSFVEIHEPAAADAVATELSCFGIHCKVLLLGHGHDAVCLPIDWAPVPAECHLAYVDMTPMAPSAVFLHTTMQDAHDDTMEHMKILHSLGFEKAVIMNQIKHCRGFVEVQFLVSVGQLEETSRPCKPTSTWPSRQPQVPDEPMYEALPSSTTPSCLLSLGVTSAQLLEFFEHSRDQTLCQLTEGLDFPEVVKQHLQHLAPVDHIDRIIIYTDGSSHSGRYHVAPELVEEQHVPDAWAFVALGEQYHEDGSVLTLLGWKAHQVRCTTDHQWHIGSRAIGPWVAEREAMIWAMLWRIGLNRRTPTIFRSDSSLTIGQAEGSLGAAHYDDTYGLLRGCHQLLSAALPEDCLRLEHIYGHNNDPWNEMADHLAKLEARTGLFLPRGEFCIAPWQPIIPYLWMVFGQQEGMPAHCHDGFAIPAPNLPPPCRLDDPQLESTSFEVKFALSLATANVLSMSSKPQGHAGKVHYLREQMICHGLNFVGFQETRGHAGSSLVNQVYRLCSGGKGGSHGVELWCNLKQPYCHVHKKPQFFCKSDFVVLHADPQRLLVKIDAKWINIWILVMHAPHSGIAASQRSEWWDTTSSLLSEHQVLAEQLFVCADVNAAPGPPDGRHVFLEGLGTSSSTPLLRSFLETFDLCLPATSHRHEGPRDTWLQPNGMHSHQIDFVMVPTCLASFCTFSSLLEAFDLGNKIEDHTATALELCWLQTLTKPLRSTAASPKPKFARDRIRSAALRLPLKTFSTSTWTCDVETHTNHMNNHLHHLLHRMCAPPKGAPKRSYVSETAWALRSTKLRHRKELKMARALLRRETLARIFAAWRAPSQQLLELSFIFGSTLRCGLLKHYSGFKCSATALQRELAGEKERQLRDTLNTIDEGTAASEIQHKLKGFMGSSNKLRQGLAPLPALRNANESMCKSSSETLARWVHFFADMEGGERLSFPQLHADWVRHLQDSSESNQVLSVQDIPSLSELEASCRRVKAGKADGPDAIPTELCKYYPVETAKMMYALMLKLVAHGHEPLLHKGGTVIPIWKGKLSKDLCEAYRSILLSSTLGKVVHRTLRVHQRSIYEAYLHAQQLGGRCHVPVTLGAHQARAFVRWHRDCGHPTAVLFVDLQEAFYRVLRQLALPGSFDDDALAKLAQRLGLGADIMHDLWQHLQEPCALERAGMSACAQRVVKALHTSTHFQLPQQGDHVRTLLGTRPGDAYADIVFGFLLARVLHAFEEKLVHAQVLSTVPQQTGMELFNVEVTHEAEECRFLGPVWMDDMALCLWSETNQGLKRKIGVATSLLLDLFREHAMTPNLRPGKTELMISPRGPGTRAWKKEMFGPLSTKCFPALGEHGLYQVHLVTSYTHLGGVLHHTGEVRAEVRRRVAIAHQAFNKHRKLIYQCKTLSLQKRAEIFRSLIMSRLLYGADSWALWDSQSKLKLHSAIMKLYRRLLGRAHSEHMQDDDILCQVGLSSPSDLLRLCRLRYIGSLCAVGNTACWGLLNRDRLWRVLVEDDMKWVWRNLANTCDLGDPAQHMHRWFEIICFHRGFWKGLLKRAEKHAILQQGLRYRCAHFYQTVRGLLADHGLWSTPEKFASLSTDAPSFGCMLCQQRCRTRGGEGAHMCKVHGQVQPIRRYIAGSQCLACLKEYHTVGQVQQHLLRSAECRAYLLQHRLHGEVLPGIGSRDNAERAQEHDGRLPPLQASGPAKPRRGGLDFSLVDFDLHDALALLIVEAQTGEEVVDMEALLRAEILQRPISWTRCRATLGELADTVTNEPQGWDAISKDVVLSIVHLLSTSSSWPFLVDLKMPDERYVATLEHMEQDCNEETLHCSDGAQCRVPRPCGRHQIVLHAFSGRRRPGDLQFYMEQMYDRAEAGVHLTVVSLDIITDSIMGDVSVKETQAFWFNYASDGAVAGFLCGPPCETWSRARFVQLQQTLSSFWRSPRPVRSGQDLWGLSSLSLREVKQVGMGNLLLCFALEMLFRLALVGAHGVLEHPDTPPDESMPSIWRLPIMRWLLQMPGMDSFSFSQGLLGAPTPKPTRLLVLNMPDLMGELRRHHLCKDPPARAAIGRDQEGAWQTTKLKEYPPAMSRALASSFVRNLTACPFEETVQLDETFVQKCAAMDTKSFSLTIGRDFASRS